jgi:AraC family transcriptional regulator
VNRLLRALEWVEASLADDIAPADAADVAALSPHHFYRYFRAVTGQSVMGYVRSRRLSLAAQRLAGRDDRIIDIALDAGFESQEAFSRAFKRRFGATPGAVRRDTAMIDPTLFQPSLTEAWLIARQEAQAMDVKFVDLDAFSIVGPVETVSKTQTEEIPAVWETFHARYGEIPGIDPTKSYGLCVHHTTAIDSFDYIAGIEVAPDATAPEGMRKVDVAPRRYAVFTFEPSGPNMPDEFRKAYAYIFEHWLPNEPYRMADASDFELYEVGRFDPATMKGEVDIYIPVEPE